MKAAQIVSTACLLLAIGDAAAEYKAGLLSVGGSASTTHISFDGGDASQTRISPMVGYSINQELSVGVSLSATFGDQLGEGFGVSPFLRTNHSFGSQLGVFFQVAPSYEFSSEDDYSIHQYGVSLGAGVYYFITPRFSLEALLGEVGCHRQVIDLQGGSNDPEQTRIFASVSPALLGISLLYHFSVP